MDDQSVERDVIESPVPGGLAQAVEAFGPVLEFFGLDPLLLLAAAEGSPDAPEQPSDDQQYRKWIQELSDVEARRLLRRFLAEDANAVKPSAHLASVGATERTNRESPTAFGRFHRCVLGELENRSSMSDPKVFSTNRNLHRPVSPERARTCVELAPRGPCLP